MKIRYINGRWYVITDKVRAVFRTLHEAILWTKGATK